MMKSIPQTNNNLITTLFYFSWPKKCGKLLLWSHTLGVGRGGGELPYGKVEDACQKLICINPQKLGTNLCVAYSMIVRVRVVLRRTVVGDWRFDNLSGSHLKVKWIEFVSRWCYKFGPLKVIGHFSHDGIGWKTLVKFVISHWSGSICLLLVKLLVWGPCIVSQIKSIC